MILMLFRSILDWIQDIIGWFLTKLRNTLIRLVIYLSVFVALLWLSIFLYGSFYFTYMPKISVIRPLNFKFRVCDNGVGICSFPTANVSFPHDEIFQFGQTYRIVLELELPESPVNEQIGMFMVRLSMYDKASLPVEIAEKATMLRYRSALLTMLMTWVYLPGFLLGTNEQKQILRLELFPHYIHDVYRPSVSGELELHSLQLQLYTATLRIHAVFTGIKYIMYYWPITSAVIGITTNMIILSLIGFLSWYQLAISKSQDKEFLSDTDSVLDDDEDNVPMAERRKQIREILEKEKQSRVEAMHRMNTQLIPDIVIGDGLPETVGSAPRFKRRSSEGDIDDPSSDSQNDVITGNGSDEYGPTSDLGMRLRHRQHSIAVSGYERSPLLLAHSRKGSVFERSPLLTRLKEAIE